MNKLLSIIIIFLLIVIFLLIFNSPKKNITLKDIPQAVSPQTSPKEPAIKETSYNDSPETDSDHKVQIDFYIIVGSFRNLTQAQQKAEKLINDFNTNIIVLPPTPEGYYRISYGKYSTFEEAKARIKSIGTTINSKAWIFSVKE